MTAKPYTPPFAVTPAVLAASTEIMRLVGRYEGLLSPKPQPKLRRRNQIRTVRGSLAVEGNTLTIGQVTAILDNKRVVGPKREIIEVQNAIAVYERAATLKPSSERDLLEAHRGMMKDLIADAGRYRSRGVGVFHGSRVAHVAPPAKQVPRLVRQLLSFMKRERALHPLITSAVAHYELELIHPFFDGNGRMGRFWQHVVLLNFHPLFEYLPVESVIQARQEAYYRVLGACDKAGSSSLFVEFSLTTIRESLEAFLQELRPEPATPTTRLAVARDVFRDRVFSRKDYLAHFKMLSTATASRDLRLGVESKILVKTGDKALTGYRFR